MSWHIHRTTLNTQHKNPGRCSQDPLFDCCAVKSPDFCDLTNNDLCLENVTVSTVQEDIDIFCMTEKSSGS